MTNPANSLPPGFRFHPTDEELILHYLRNRAASSPCPVSIIAEVDIYKFDPWDLPDKAMFGDREWYFFSPRDRKYPNGIRPNRAAASGYWKATGTDKPIHASNGNENIGVKKALVFYKGRPPKGLKTNWIMHEYRLAEAHTSNSYRPMRLKDSSMRLDDWVLCRIYRKSSHISTVQQSLDNEQEDYIPAEAYLPVEMANSGDQKIVDLHKSSSLSEFLNLLFDNPSDVLGNEQVPVAGSTSLSQPFYNSTTTTNNNGGNYLFQQLQKNEAENSLKRPRMADGYGEEDGGVLQPAKKHNNSFCSFPSVNNQIESSQYSLLSQPFINHQLLLNSHRGRRKTRYSHAVSTIPELLRMHCQSSSAKFKCSLLLASLH